MEKTRLEGQSSGGLYPIHLQLLVLNKPLVMAAVVGVKIWIPVWYFRLGHASNLVVTQFLNERSLFYVGSLNNSKVCELC